MHRIIVKEVDSLCNPRNIKVQLNTPYGVVVSSKLPGVYLYTDESDSCEVNIEYKSAGVFNFTIGTQVASLGKFNSREDLENFIKAQFVGFKAEFDNDYGEIADYVKASGFFDDQSEAYGLLINKAGIAVPVALSQGMLLSGDELCDVDKVIMYIQDQAVLIDWDKKLPPKLLDVRDYMLKCEDETLLDYIQLSLQYEELGNFKTVIDPRHTFKHFPGLTKKFNICVVTPKGIKLPYCAEVIDDGDVGRIKIKMNKNIKSIQKVRAIVAELPGPVFNYTAEKTYKIRKINGNEEYEIPTDGSFISVEAGVYKCVNDDKKLVFVGCNKIHDDVIPVLFNQVVTLIDRNIVSDDTMMEVSVPKLNMYTFEDIINVEDENFINYKGDFNVKCEGPFIFDCLTAQMKSGHKCVCVMCRRIDNNNDLYVKNFLENVSRYADKARVVIDVKPGAYNFNSLKPIVEMNMKGIIFKVIDLDSIKEVMKTIRKVPMPSFWIEDGKLLKEALDYLSEKKHITFYTPDDKTIYPKDERNRIVIVNGSPNKASGFAGVAKHCNHSKSHSAINTEAGAVQDVIKDFMLEEDAMCCDQLNWSPGDSSKKCLKKRKGMGELKTDLSSPLRKLKRLARQKHHSKWPMEKISKIVENY